jgi:ATP-dependent Clp protease ATP-binding subunit ClpC
MFERFGDDARRVVVSAQEDARRLGHDHIGTEHLLLALARVDGGAVFGTFRFFELTYDGLRQRVEQIAPGGIAPSGHIPFTPRAKHALELSLREALALHDETIRAEHILLGVLTEGSGVAVRVLEGSGVELGAMRERLLEQHGDGSSHGDDQPRGELRSARATAARATGRSAMPMLGPFGAGRPVPRCALCGRDEERVERMLVAGGVRLCADCARAAAAQLDALPPDAPKLVRYRRPEHAPSDKEAAIAAIEVAFDAVFSPVRLPDDDALAYVEGGEEARDVLQALREGSEHAPMVPSDQTVERVRFLDEDSAEVSYGIWMPGNPQPMLFPVHAVREDGIWKVSRSAVEHFARLAEQFRRPGF